jgi:hypothetical protein
MNDKPKSKLHWRLLRWGLIALAVLVTLAAALVTEENWRAKRDWENYKRAAELRGERFDLASLVPPVPDDQNFFGAPIVAETLKLNRAASANGAAPHGMNSASRLNFNIYPGDLDHSPTNGGNWQKGKLTDLKEWQTYFRNYAASSEGKAAGFSVPEHAQTPAADILFALKAHNPALAELRQASLRPYARIPLNYENGFETAGELMPWLATTKRCAQFLQLRTLAELEDGQSQAALDDINLMFRVSDSVRAQPFLISHLVRIAIATINLQSIYEGLMKHRWSEAQLTELEQQLARQDFLTDFEFTMRGEKNTAVETFEKQRISRESKQMVEIGGTNKIETTSYRFMPSAYFYRNELTFAQMHERFIVPLADLTNRIVAPASLLRAEMAVQSEFKHYSPYTIHARMLHPAIAKAVEKFARIQMHIDLARVACALERFHLVQGNYPETLHKLAPGFIEKIPHDLINGEPLHYRKTEDGRFILYSIGWDEKDDGGNVFLNKSGAVDQKKGDWVWKY